MSSSNQRIAVIDATAAGKGRRRFTRDAIGCGVRSVCGVLEEHNIKSKILLAENIIDQGFQKKFTSLFISGMSMDKVAIKKIVKIWRKNHQGKIVVGGPVTSELEQSLKQTKADLIVIGEGELTLKELIDSNYLTSGKISDIKDINGIGYINQNNQFVLTGFRKYSSSDEFKAFKASTKRITDYPNYFSAKVYVECLRGCSNFGGTRIQLPDGRKCSECGLCDSDYLEDRANCPSEIPPGCGFCSVPSLYGPSRSKSVEHIVNEIEKLVAFNVKRIVLSAPDFLDFGRDELISPKPLITPSSPKANSKKIKELLSKIHAIERVAKGHVWFEVENIKATLFTDELARILSEYLPNSPFSIGCETGSETHAKLLGRPSGPKDTLRAVKIAHKYGLKAHVYFIHSLPGQTRKTAQETADFINKLEPYIEKVTIYRFRPLPLSAFGDFPDPPPAVYNLESKIIVDAANHVNLMKKKNLVGEVVRVIISEPNYRDEKGAIAYILSGGPMVAVENSRERIGEIVEVKILRALSEKLVLGTIFNS
ncbi:MAG: B12-binding domain-containing radical SAM protein [Candidatus Heimdallarchaeota archaeon]|nr:B12-binding domain-containing radical SAM protein [Candidatus Heimdallarchaeota archaeon]MCK5298357.1 B12-binding domain-containing radical SAM protein [Candidatus Heimdallarchaeota archaeon]